jgi:hypothetical protein
MPLWINRTMNTTAVKHREKIPPIISQRQARANPIALINIKVGVRASRNVALSTAYGSPAPLVNLDQRLPIAMKKVMKMIGADQIRATKRSHFGAES